MPITSSTHPPQSMLPHGLAGRLFGRLMEQFNRGAYARAVSLIDLPTEGSVLELGFGTGRLLEMLAVKSTDGFFAGIDASPLMVATARRRLDRRHVARDLRQGNAEYLPWPEDSFDAVAALHCFQFWADPVSALCEVQRVLRPGGTFLLILRRHGARDAERLPNPWSRTPHEIEDVFSLLKKAGFEARRELPDARNSPIIVAKV
ncbi:class I SAM-dependent methyltransferase [Parvibaculum sp.]|uniref:class I SAM-dependent methyltransferase n=1 Tax=Parvibaculum sp. TaxID=2024848 RepID=UPI002C31BB19|nr:class I SAM-dependent methyltransferase [Parvibaculum sp.]HUD50894.1 class I SAM-dependent methyltransferase [Parvibaculum sp.]